MEYFGDTQGSIFHTSGQTNDTISARLIINKQHSSTRDLSQPAKPKVSGSVQSAQRVDFFYRTVPGLGHKSLILIVPGLLLQYSSSIVSS